MCDVINKRISSATVVVEIREKVIRATQTDDDQGGKPLGNIAASICPSKEKKKVE